MLSFYAHAFFPFQAILDLDSDSKSFIALSNAAVTKQTKMNAANNKTSFG